MKFSEIISPVSVADFFSNYLGQKPFHLSRKNCSFYDSLLSIRSVEEIFSNNSLAYDSFRVFNKNQRTSKDEWLKRIPNDKQESEQFTDTFTDYTKLLELFRKGASIELNFGKIHHPSIAALLKDANENYKIYPIAKAFLTPSNSYSLDPHYDNTHILILQTYGEKKWECWKPTVFNPGLNLGYVFNHNLGKPDFSCTLCAGDMLYLPRGWWHKPYTENHASLQISLGMRITDWHNFVHTFADQLIKQDVFRNEVPPFITDEKKKFFFISSLKKNIHEIIDQTDWETLLSKHHNNIGKVFLNTGNQRVAQLLLIDELTEDALFCVESLVKKTSGDDSSFYLHNNDARHSFPLIFKKAIQYIISESSMSISSIPGQMHAEMKKDLLRQIVIQNMITVKSAAD